MEKRIALIALTSSALLILDVYNAYESFFLFLLGGVVPGTSYVLSPSTMLTLTTSCIVIIIAIALISLIPARKRPGISLIAKHFARS